jgi:hypothetical protein
MLSHAINLAVLAVVLIATGLVTRPVAEPAWAEVRAQEPAFQLQSLEGTLGQGLTFGLLGGFRAVIADFLWLQAYVHWQDEDLPATQKMIDVVTTVDPRPHYFWINGARIIAYDMPVWRERATARAGRLDPAMQARISEEQSRAALGLLRRGLDAHPNDPLLLIEAGNIHYRRRHDVATASEFYRVASLQPGAPFYAARLHAVFLEEQGRVRDAYEWLCALYPTLPRDNPLANRDEVLDRIRRLEGRLGITGEGRFDAGG